MVNTHGVILPKQGFRWRCEGHILAPPFPLYTLQLVIVWRLTDGRRHDFDTMRMVPTSSRPSTNRSMILMLTERIVTMVRVVAGAFAVVAGCGPCVDVGTSPGDGRGGAGGSSATSSSSRAASSSSGPADASADAACPLTGDPYWDACMACPPPASPCVTPGCSEVTPGYCLQTQTPPGSACLSGVGTCDASGNCVPPPGDCEAPPWEPRSCCAEDPGDVCDDGNACTEDQCNGSCFHVPTNDGLACGVGRTCRGGACCAPL